VIDVGGIKCWGDNIYGQLGDGTSIVRTTPVYVAGLTSAASTISAGLSHSCTILEAGGAKCWGANGSGQLGDGTTTNRTMPVDVIGLSSGVSAIATGGGHTCALTAGGGVKCWGWNANGQLGDGTTTDRATPVDVVGLGSGVRAIAAGRYHTCALIEGGALKCWGFNAAGQLGDGTTTDRAMPVDVAGLGSGVVAVAAGDRHTCAVTTGGAALCWGANENGQLGDGTTTQHATPVGVSGLNSSVRAVAAGGCHTCALTGSGGVKCWGWNGYGQLGDGTTAGRSTPVDVLDLSVGAGATTTGSYHTCALVVGGGVRCWGYNQSGQLGDGTTQDRTIPVHVAGFGVDIRRYLPLILHQ
jgi:alpha-tubulin suppressor-like RCC1 family protein